MNLLIYNLSLLAGLALIVAGVAIVSVSAALIAAGTLVIALTIFNASLAARVARRDS